LQQIHEEVSTLRNDIMLRARSYMRDRVLAASLPPPRTPAQVLAEHGGNLEAAIAAARRTNVGVNARIERLRGQVAAGRMVDPGNRISGLEAVEIGLGVVFYVQSILQALDDLEQWRDRNYPEGFLTRASYETALQIAALYGYRCVRDYRNGVQNGEVEGPDVIPMLIEDQRRLHRQAN